MKKTLEKYNYAFIDSQNVNLGIKDQHWRLDFARFRVYLKDKYRVRKAFLFLGYIPKYQKLYTFLKKSGYTLVFKPVLLSNKREVKGNVDAELVLHAMIEINNYQKAVIVTGDGDFYCLIEYLVKKKRLFRLVVPNYYKYSALLRKFTKNTDFMNHLKDKLMQKKRGINLRTKP